MVAHHEEYSRHPKKNNAAQIPVILGALQQKLINALQKTVCTKSNAHTAMRFTSVKQVELLDPE